MPAISGEPWRGLAKVQFVGAAGQMNFTASITDVVPSTAAANQPDWTGEPGAAVTIRVEWEHTGVLPEATPNLIRIATNLPSGGAQIGSTQSFNPGAALTGVQTFTMHFDDNPFDGAVGTATGGMLEIILHVEKNDGAGGVGNYTADSRGASTSLNLLTTFNWGRSKFRAPEYLVTHTIGNQSAGSNDLLVRDTNHAQSGQAKSVFHATDPIFQRFTITPTYRAISVTASLRKPGNGAAERTQTGSASTAANRDFTWNSTSAGNTAYVGAGMTLAEELKDVRLDLPATSFGGDAEYVWGASGHAAGFVRDSDASIRNPARITVDPRTYHNILFHTQVQGREMGTPPSATNTTNGQRKFPAVGYVGDILRNANDEGLNEVDADLLGWPADDGTASKDNPAHSFSGTTKERRTDTSPAESGVLPLQDSGSPTLRNSLPIQWDTVFAGAWRWYGEITAPSALVSTEEYSLTEGAQEWNRNLFYIASDPNILPVLIAGPPFGQGHEDHPRVDGALGFLAWLGDFDTNKNVPVVPANGDFIRIGLRRINTTTFEQIQSYDHDGTQQWADKGTGGDFVFFDMVPLTDVVPTADPNLYTVTLPAGAAHSDKPITLTAIMWAQKNGSPYQTQRDITIFPEGVNQHDGYAFNPFSGDPGGR